MTFQRDLFLADTAPPPPGRYRVRFTGHERLTSEARGAMWRLAAVIVTGPYAGRPAYKMLTDDLKGFEWLERTILQLGLRRVVTREQGLAALVGQEASVGTYHYQHPREGTFLTIRNVHVLRGR